MSVKFPQFDKPKGASAASDLSDGLAWDDYFDAAAPKVLFWTGTDWKPGRVWTGVGWRPAQFWTGTAWVV